MKFINMRNHRLSLFIVIFFMLLLSIHKTTQFENKLKIKSEVVTISEEEQNKRIEEVNSTCIKSVNFNRKCLKCAEFVFQLALVQCCNVIVANISCPTTFDSVACWLETPVNTTIHQNCPNYISMFLFKNKASRTCFFNGTIAVWSITNYSLCIGTRKPEEEKALNIAIKHYSNMRILRVVGYVVSMTTLLLSIFIMLAVKRLRCPRNYVHINLFCAIALRTILTIISGELIDATKFSPDETSTVVDNKIETKTYIICRLAVFLFRYTGAVYNVAIFSEALYLVLILKFPFYKEKSGYKFCIALSWVLPLVWVIPWLIARMTIKIEDESVWCWQAESELNLIYKVPHSLLLLCNVVSACFILRVLYTKLNTKVSREKVIKYRRLAKSILILIPIFGLHFIFFLWSPYVELDLKFTLVSNYIESFFNSFQGFVVSIACCFIQREVRFETILFICKLLKLTKCHEKFPCCSCISPKSINEFRQRYTDRISFRAPSSYDPRFKRSVYHPTDEDASLNTSSRLPSQCLTENMQSSSTQLNHMSLNHNRKDSRASNVSQLSANASGEVKCFKYACYDCLFDKNKRNDFYQTAHNKRKHSTTTINTSIKNIYKKKNLFMHMNHLTFEDVQRFQTTTTTRNTLDSTTNNQKCTNILTRKVGCFTFYTKNKTQSNQYLVSDSIKTNSNSTSCNTNLNGNPNGGLEITINRTKSIEQPKQKIVKFNDNTELDDDRVALNPDSSTSSSTSVSTGSMQKQAHTEQITKSIMKQSSYTAISLPSVIFEQIEKFIDDDDSEDEK